MIELLSTTFLLLLLAGVAGHGTRLFGRTDDNRAATWGMRVSLTAALGAAVAVVVLAVRQLAACDSATACTRPLRVLPLPPPAGGVPALDLTLRVDATAALFLLLVGVSGACVAVYSFGWLRCDELRNRVAGSFSLFLFAMILVVVVDNIFWLFVALELMTFSSGDLVRYRGASGGPAPASRTAVRTYLIISQISLMSLVIGVLPLAARYASLDMSVLGASGGSPVPSFSFSFILLGLAMRAGVTPFHFWVPTVHPQLPTNTHAMVSAVMLKIPVYLMLRFFIGGIVGPVQWWWGAVILVLAGLTAVVTVFYAMLASDLKVALAYHSVENIGIILAGLGLALLFSDHRFAVQPALRDAAGLALLASLYHVVNHGLFKSLLFLCVGSIERHARTVQMRRLGGLWHTLPWTTFSFLIGAGAIAELPGLNGFVSSWLTLQAVFGGQRVYHRQSPAALFIMPAVIVALVALGLAIGATGLAFVKMASQSLLGAPRGGRVPGSEHWSMRTIMAGLAGSCLLLGLQPWLLVPWLSAALKPLHHPLSGLVATPGRLAISIPGAHGAPPYQAALPILPLLLLAGSAIGLTMLLRAWQWTRRPVWAGGTAFDPSTMEYSGNTLSALLWEPMSQRHGAAARASGPDTPTSREDRGSAAPYQEDLPLSARRSVLELANYACNRMTSRIVAISDWFGSRFQNGDVRSYLLYMLVIVLLILTMLAVAR